MSSDILGNLKRAILDYDPDASEMWAKKAIEANPSMPLLLNPGYVEYAERLEELRKKGEITLREYDRRRKEMFDFYNKVSENL